MAIGETREAVCNFKKSRSIMGIRFENGESRLQGSRGSLPCRMLFSFPMRWDMGAVANQHLGKGEGRVWFDDFPGSDHHGSMCHARTTTRASRRDVVFTLASFKSSRFLPPQTYQLHSPSVLPLSSCLTHTRVHTHTHPTLTVFVCPAPLIPQDQTLNDQ